MPREKGDIGKCRYCAQRDGTLSLAAQCQDPSYAGRGSLYPKGAKHPACRDTVEEEEGEGGQLSLMNYKPGATILPRYYYQLVHFTGEYSHQATNI